MHHKQYVITFLIIILSTLQLISEEKDSDDTIKVIADQVTDVEKIKRSSTFVDIVPTGKAYQRVDSVSEVLSERVGVQTKRLGGLGSYSTISIRGSNPNQVVIYLDGIPLNDAKFGEVNLENLPIDNLERIEIYRGFTPVRFGISGIGGVVNLVTKRAEDHATNLASISYGSFNTSKITLSRSQKFKEFDYLLFFNRTGSDGDFRFKDDGGTPVVNTEDDSWKKRENNQHVSYSLTAKAGYKFDNFRLSVVNDFFYKDQGLPGMYNNEIKDVSFTTTRNIANLKAEAPKFIINNISAELNLFYALRRDLFDNSCGEDIGLGGAMKQKGFFDSFGVDTSSELVLPKLYQTIKLLLSFQRETYKSRETSNYTDYAEETGPEQKRDRFSIAIEDEVSIIDDRLQIAPQFRYEHWRQRFCEEDALFGSTNIEVGGENRSNHYGGQIGVRFFLFNRLFFIKGNIGRNHRAPTFTELFGERGYIVGNPKLKPEKSINRDIGCGIDRKKKFLFFDWIRFDYAFFYNTIEDIIIFIHNSQWTMKAQNVDEARIMGHETAIALSILNHLILSGNYTLQEAIDKSDIPYYTDNYLPHRPKNEASLRAKAFNKYAALIYELSYTGVNFRDRANSEFYYIDERTIHNLTFQVFPYKGISFTFEIKNLSDNMTRDVIGYPLPGRSYYGTFAVKF